MKAKNYFLTALAALALASCANESLLSESPLIVPETDTLTAIGFGSMAKAKTRITREKSAELLGNKFYVYGSKTKGESTSPIFDNYVVEYAENTAGETATNTHDWEYAGKTSRKGAIQGVKYWDFSADHFDFVAASGIAEGELIKNTTDGMRINVPNAVAMTSIYVADRVTATPVAKAATDTEPATTAYKDVVQFQFRRLGAQMRIGFYETVPGYAVKDLVFYYIGAPSGSYEVGVGSAFPQSGKFTVEYNDATNAAKTTFAGADNTMAFSSTFGELDYTAANTLEGITDKPYLDRNGAATATPVKAFLGTTSSEATYGKGTYTIDGEAGVVSAYKPILPYEQNSQKMQIRVDYTLVALDGSRDSIHVRDAYVSVPASFLKWKPNYSYTYLFKISDKSNGYTGKGGGGNVTNGPGRDPNPTTGGDNDPAIDPNTGQVTPPYIPDPDFPNPWIPDPDSDDPEKLIPNPDAPLIPNPLYPDGPGGDQHDPSNPVPVPTVPDPDNPGSVIDDPENPAHLFPITFDAVVVEAEEGSQTVYTVVDGTDNTSENEH